MAKTPQGAFFEAMDIFRGNWKKTAKPKELDYYKEPTPKKNKKNEPFIY